GRIYVDLNFAIAKFCVGINSKKRMRKNLFLSKRKNLWRLKFCDSKILCRNKFKKKNAKKLVFEQEEEFMET
ncbi:MAG: hypothetical protein IJ756_00520, partial [Paludibacteraceae bacterium]|nr:hypothetical protein [Paludibacteraceae bacterium]